MSSSRLSLKSPPVIAAVVVLGIAVTLLNIQTFGSKRPRRRPPPAQVRVQEYPVLPADLEQVVQQALQARTLPPATDKPAGGGVAPRDPFRREGHAAHSPVAVRPQPQAAPDSLRCAAVLLGGKRPVALIDGKPCTLGSYVRGMTVVGIAYDGVQLRKPDGSLLHLPLISGQTSERNGS